MAKKKTKTETPVNQNEIEILDWDQINELFDVNEKQVRKFLTNRNNTENFWYPYENKFSEEETTEITELFKKKFIDIEINNKHGIRYTEIVLSTLDKHIFAYSVINHIKNLK